MSKKTVPLAKLVRAIAEQHGFSVTLAPLDSAPVAKSSGLAARIGHDAPDVETVETHGVTITRVVGSVTDNAPHGTDIAGKVLAPFGMLKDGSRPRKSPAGRPPSKTSKASKPTGKPAAAPKSAPAPGGFSLDLSDLGGSAPTPAPKAPPKAPPAPAKPETASDVLADLAADLGLDNL